MSVSDAGAGLPESFKLDSASSLGMRLVMAFADQMGATVVVEQLHPGTRFIVDTPVDAA